MTTCAQSPHTAARGLNFNRETTRNILHSRAYHDWTQVAPFCHKGICYGQLMPPSTYRCVCKPCLLQTAPRKPCMDYIRHCATWYAGVLHGVSWFFIFTFFTLFCIHPHKSTIDTRTHLQGNLEAKHNIQMCLYMCIFNTIYAYLCNIYLSFYWHRFDHRPRFPTPHLVFILSSSSIWIYLVFQVDTSFWNWFWE